MRFHCHFLHLFVDDPSLQDRRHSPQSTKASVVLDVVLNMKKLHRLSDRTVKTTLPGKYCDGAGLYLVVAQGRAGINRNWMFRYGVGDRQRWHGLGGYPLVGLADARRRAQNAHEVLARGQDPIAHNAAVRAALSQKHAPQSMSFRQCAEAYIKAHEAGWRGVRVSYRWSRSLAMHVYPLIGDKDVAKVTTEDVLTVLTRIWTSLPETAVQVRGRIELVLDWARVRGFRSGENVATWRGHLAHLLPKRSRVARVRHHPALPYKELPAFMALLRQSSKPASICFQLLILTACRTAEAVLARWTEIDLDARVWTIPAERTKALRNHRIPLSDAAIDLLKRLPRINEYVFPGPHTARMNLAALRLLLRQMGRPDITPHGMRSTFRDWAGNETHFPRELAEAALAHMIGDKAEQAYRRDDALERRRQLMQQWAIYCAGKGAEIIPLRNVS
jgi:integrase